MTMEQLTSEELEFQRVANTIVKDYSIDDHNDIEIIMLSKYFNGDKSIEEKGIYCGKGLLIMGNVGSGKTLLMSIFQRMAFNKNKKTFFQKNVGVLCSEYRGSGEATIYKHKLNSWFFDELGLQAENVNDYGNKFNIMEEIIRQRHIEFTNNGTITHFTTNLHEEQLAEFYDERTASRLREMCNFITLKAPDRRKSTIPKERPDKSQPKEVIPTPEQQEKIISNSLLAHIEKVREAGTWVKVANNDVISDIYYDFLAERGIINYTPSERTQVFDNACLRLIDAPNLEDALRHRNEWNIFRTAVQEKKPIPQNNFFRQKIIQKCKKDLYKEFVMQVAKNRTDIYKLLNF